MKRRWMALLCTLVLVLQLTMPAAKAAGSVYYTAVGSHILALSDDTMPFWSEGYLYISGAAFSDYMRNAVDVAYVHNRAKQMVVLYGGGQTLIYDLASDGIGRDTSGKTYEPKIIQRGGTVFLPVSTIAQVFGLKYTLMNVEHGRMAWLRQTDYPLSEKQYMDAAAYQMNQYYSQYVNSKIEPEPETPPAPETPEESVTPVVTAGVYLCLALNSSAGNLADVLTSEREQAAFFGTEEAFRKESGLLRRLTAQGWPVGILVDGSSETDVLTQANRANDAFMAAACTKTRMVLLQSGTAEQRQTLRDAGFCCIRVSMDRSGFDLKTAAQATALFQKLPAQRGASVIWLGGRAGSVGMRSFLRQVKEANGRCLALTEKN